MTSQEPFSPEQPPDRDADADAGVSAESATFAHSDVSDAAAPPQGYAAPPGYVGQPPGAPHQLPSTDPVSIVALVAGVLGTGPLAFVLGAIGLRRTVGGVRRGRGMAWAGAILGLLATIGWLLLIAFVVFIVNNADQTTGLS